MSPVKAQTDWGIFVLEWQTVVVPLVVFSCCLAAGFLFRTVFFRSLRKWSANSSYRLDTVIISTLRAPMIIWAVILGFDLATRSSILPKQYAEPIHMTLDSLWIISITIIAAQLTANVVRLHSSHELGPGRKPPTLTTSITQIVISILGLLFLLNYLKVDIRPLLTALGVGGLAVALALQGTLSNLFAGLYISASSQIRVGDYIKLESGEEGYVIDITWRSTTIRSIANNHIFIPNSKLSQDIVTNYSLPSTKIGIGMIFHVGFDTDIAKVESLLVEEAVKDLIDGLVTEPPPYVQWSPGFGDFWVPLTLNVEITEFSKQFKVQSELRKRIYKRLQAEGIALPYPTQLMITKPSQPS
jgi:small-conductance mechanosensitive channel